MLAYICEQLTIGNIYFGPRYIKQSAAVITPSVITRYLTVQTITKEINTITQCWNDNVVVGNICHRIQNCVIISITFLTMKVPYFGKASESWHSLRLYWLPAFVWILIKTKNNPVAWSASIPLDPRPHNTITPVTEKNPWGKWADIPRYVISDRPGRVCCYLALKSSMMTSSNGNISCVTGHLCG